jgi:hypothetical protein
MASRVQCWRAKTTWSGRPGERNAFRPHFVVHPHRLLQSNLRAARIVIGRPCRIDGIQPSNCVAWAKIHNNLYSDEPGSAASRLSRPCLPSRAFSKFESYRRLETAASRGWKAKDAIEWFHGIGRLDHVPTFSLPLRETNADDCVEGVLRKAFAKRPRMLDRAMQPKRMSGRRPRGREQSPGPRR